MLILEKVRVYYQSGTTSKNWTLPTGDGTKTVYVTYRNASGKTVGPVSDTIILDTTEPTLTVSAPASTSSSSPTIVNSASYTVSGTASDATSGLESVGVMTPESRSEATISGNNWSKTINLTMGTTTPVRVYAIDNAGKGTGEIRYVKYIDPNAPKYWNDGFSNTIYAFPNTPSTIYYNVAELRTRYGSNNFASRPFYIKTTTTEHQACLYYNNKEFCMTANYWDTDAATTQAKLKGMFRNNSHDLNEAERLEYINIYCSDELKQKLEN